jgi:1-deoxy-D-xylulose-5-phosphate synthase
VLRFPKTPLGPDLPAVRTAGTADVLYETVPGDVDVLVVSVGAVAADALEAARAVAQAGYSIRVIDPRWVQPVEKSVLEQAARADLVVTIEDGIVVGGVGSRISQEIRRVGLDVACREIGIPGQFLTHGKVADVRAAAGLSVQALGRRIVEWSALVQRNSDPGGDVPAARHSGGLNGDD